MPKLAAALLATTALAIAGCGASDASPEERTTSTTASAPRPSASPISSQALKGATTPCATEGHGAGVYVGPQTSCPFAMAVTETYAKSPAWEPSSPKTETVTAYSSTTHKSYAMACTPIGSEKVGCTGGHSALVVFLIAEGSRIAVEATEAKRKASEPEDEVGSTSHAGDAKFCEEHHCIGEFDSEDGTVVECSDGTFSHAGGIPGACSYHGGEAGSSSGSKEEEEGEEEHE
jgi:hypothetical protein